MHDHLYLNYPQYMQDNPNSFRILLLRNLDTKTDMWPRLVETIEGTLEAKNLVLMPLPSAFSTMVACQVQILLAENSGHFSIKTSAQTSQARQVKIKTGTHYLEQIQPEDISLLIDSWGQMFRGA